MKSFWWKLCAIVLAYDVITNHFNNSLKYLLYFIATGQGSFDKNYFLPKLVQHKCVYTLFFGTVGFNI